MAKDLFSKHSKIYSKYRPRYPQELFDHILRFVEHREKAWDCATGNGQAAGMLAKYFTKVEASDISASQINEVESKPNIQYHICSAENTLFEEKSFDLITVATAYHWLQWKKFYDEAIRVGKRNAVVAIWAYNILRSDEDRLNDLIMHFYKDITGPYWEAERKYVDEEYESVEFDFEQLPGKKFNQVLEWNKEQFTGFLESWSAVQKYKRVNGISPLDLIKNDIDRIWEENAIKKITIPLFLRMGRVVG